MSEYIDESALWSEEKDNKDFIEMGGGKVDDSGYVDETALWAGESPQTLDPSSDDAFNYNPDNYTYSDPKRAEQVAGYAARVPFDVLEKIGNTGEYFKTAEDAQTHRFDPYRDYMERENFTGQPTAEEYSKIIDGARKSGRHGQDVFDVETNTTRHIAPEPSWVGDLTTPITDYIGDKGKQLAQYAKGMKETPGLLAKDAEWAKAHPVIDTVGGMAESVAPWMAPYAGLVLPFISAGDSAQTSFDKLKAHNPGMTDQEAVGIANIRGSAEGGLLATIPHAQSWLGKAVLGKLATKVTPEIADSALSGLGDLVAATINPSIGRQVARQIPETLAGTALFTGQSMVSSAMDRGLNIDPSADPMAGLGENVGTSFLLSAIFAGKSGYSQSKGLRELKSYLETPTAKYWEPGNVDDRSKAASFVYESLKTDYPEAAKNWAINSSIAIHGADPVTGKLFAYDSTAIPINDTFLRNPFDVWGDRFVRPGGPEPVALPAPPVVRPHSGILNAESVDDAIKSANDALDSPVFTEAEQSRNLGWAASRRLELERKSQVAELSPFEQEEYGVLQEHAGDHDKMADTYQWQPDAQRQEQEAQRLQQQGWLHNAQPTEADQGYAQWLQQRAASLAYNQDRNALGSTPQTRSGLMGNTMGTQGTIDPNAIQTVVNQASFDQNYMGPQPTAETSALAAQQELTPTQQRAERQGDLNEAFGLMSTSGREDDKKNLAGALGTTQPHTSFTPREVQAGEGMPVTADSSALVAQQELTPEQQRAETEGMYKDLFDAADTEAKRQKVQGAYQKQVAMDTVNADPAYEHMAEAKRRGGLNLAQFGTDYDHDTINLINKRYPGIFSKNGGVSPDDFAGEMGYGSLDDMVRTFSETKTKKEMVARSVEDFKLQDEQGKAAQKIYDEHGIDIGPAQNMQVGELNTGDKVVVEGKNGIPDLVTVKAVADDGTATLKDGVTIHAAPDDTLHVMGMKLASEPIDFDTRMRQADQFGPERIRKAVIREPGESNRAFLARRRQESADRKVSLETTKEGSTVKPSGPAPSPSPVVVNETPVHETQKDLSLTGETQTKPGKEPWQQTKQEFDSNPKTAKDASHYNAVHSAVTRGEVVPDRVLADYPDIKKLSEEKNSDNSSATKQTVGTSAQVPTESKSKQPTNKNANVTDQQLKQEVADDKTGDKYADIPDGKKVTTLHGRNSSGGKITEHNRDAKEALKELDDDIEKYHELLGCLQS